MEQLLPDGEGNYINLRHVRYLIARACGDDICKHENGWHAVAYPTTGSRPIVLNTNPLPTCEAAQVLLERQLARSVDLAWAARVLPGDGG